LKTWIEFHDSELTAVNETNHGVTVDLDAYVHRWESSGDSWHGTGWMQPVRILISGAAHERLAAVLPLGVSDGRLRVGAITHLNVVPLPFDALDAVGLWLQLVNADIVEIEGAGVTVEPCGEASFVEDLPADLRPVDARLSGWRGA